MSEDRLKSKVEINKRRNRLYCAFVGYVTKDDLEEIFNDIRKAVSELKPNFSVINDLTLVNFGHNSAIPVLLKIMQFLVTQGMKDIVRVVNDKSVIYTQMNNLSIRQQGYVPVYVNSMDDAEKYLEESANRQHLQMRMRNKSIEFKCKDQIYLGALLTLSLGGCSIESEIKTLALGDEVKLIFSLLDQKKMNTQFVINAEVIQISENDFAVNFKATMPSVLKKLNECIAECFFE